MFKCIKKKRIKRNSVNARFFWVEEWNTYSFRASNYSYQEDNYGNIELGEAIYVQVSEAADGSITLLDDFDFFSEAMDDSGSDIDSADDSDPDLARSEEKPSGVLDVFTPPPTQS
jgi:hypothetical protein